MWEQIFEAALSNGIWTVLFVALLIYQLKDSASREEKYQKTIQLLTEKYAVIEDIKEDILEIKSTLQIPESGELEHGDKENKDK